MKFLITMICLLMSSQAFTISHKEFVKLRRDQRELIVKAYKDFLGQYSKTVEISSTPKITFPDFIAAAYASDYNCVYAGWPSSRVSGFCSQPRSNPAFQRESCGQNEMPCQPLLFGRGLCVSTASRDQRRSAFANCEKKFIADGRNLAQVVEYISDPELASQADELFRLVDEICRTGAQASTPMCRNLKARVESIKSQRPAAAPTAASAQVPKAEPQQALTVAAEEAAQVTSTVKNLNTETRCESCDAQRAQTVDEPDRTPVRVTSAEPEPTTAFPRIESGFTLASCGGRGAAPDGYSTRNVMHCTPGNEDRVFAGYSFQQDSRTHPMIRDLQNPYPGSTGRPSRFWDSISVNSAFNETYLIMEETVGGPDSHNVKSYMFIIPRVTVPSVRVEGNNIISTLTTGETVTMDKTSKAILSGALTEGPLDMNMDRFQRKPPNIHYNGAGISIRLNHRYEHPLTSSETAVVKQGTKTCNVPRTALFDAEGKMKTTSDAALLAVLNQSCRGGGFRLP